MVRFRVFAMYLRTELVHTYIAKRPSSLVYIITGPGMGEQAQAGQVLRLSDSSIRGGPFDCGVGKEKVYPDSGYTSFYVWMGAVPVLPGA